MRLKRYHFIVIFLPEHGYAFKYKNWQHVLL